MKRSIGLLLTILLISAAAMLMVSIAAGQEEVGEEAPQIRRYTVELLVFAYAENVSVGTEVFPPDEPVIVEDEFLPDGSEPLPDDGPLDPAPDSAAEPGQVAKATLEAETEPGTRVLEPVLLIEDEFTMQRTIERLERLDAYEPIMHVGWTQATFPLEESEAIDLAFFGKAPKGLEGSFMLYLGRYLHLVVDLALDAPGQDDGPQRFDEPIVSFGDDRLMYEDDYRLREGAIRYRIQENRIIKNGDIRYFDHPKFGVIAKIIRVEEPEEEEDLRPESQQLLGGLRQ